MPIIKTAFRYVSEDTKAKLSTSKCLVTISVGQEVHESEKFFATTQLIGQSFQECILLVDDSLQRHSMALDKPQDAEYFYEPSIIAGDLWLERNQSAIENLTNLTTIMRWDHWLMHEKYQLKQEQVLQLIDNDAEFSKAFDETVQEFLRRYTSRLDSNSEFCLDRAYQLCFDYLLEECTAMSLWPETGCHFEVYPSRRSLAMTMAHEKLVLPTFPDLLHPVAIKFKNRKQLKAQEFTIMEDTMIQDEIEKCSPHIT